MDANESGNLYHSFVFIRAIRGLSSLHPCESVFICGYNFFRISPEARMNHWFALVILFLISATAYPSRAAGILDKRKVLERQTFWDNRDWDWYEANIPILETPDPEIDTTYYYRWELV